MLEPIQRIPRYKLLLLDYLKYLPPDSPDRPDTESEWNGKRGRERERERERERDVSSMPLIFLSHFRGPRYDFRSS